MKGRTAVRAEEAAVKRMVRYGLYALALLCIIVGVALVAAGPSVGWDYAVRVSSRYNSTWDALVHAGGMFYQALGVGILELGIIVLLLLELNKSKKVELL